MQPTDPHARVKEGPLPGLWGPHSSSFSRVKAHYDMELVMGSASSFTKEVERNKALLIKDAPPQQAPRVSVGTREVRRRGASSGGSPGWLWG